MKFDHIHFYVEDAEASRNWFIEKLGFRGVGQAVADGCHTEAIANGPVYILLSSPRESRSPVAKFLAHHPPGVADVAFRVADVDGAVGRAVAGGAKLLEPLQHSEFAIGTLRWATISGWGDLRHSLVEVKGIPSDSRLLLHCPSPVRQAPSPLQLTAIDHVVLNVDAGDLETALKWYERVLGLQPQQTFNIQTDRSGLQSRVMVHPEGETQFPINQPASDTSQIQEFLDVNRGSGIQHIALRSDNIIHAIRSLKRRNLPFLSVPQTYYEQMKEKGGDRRLQGDWDEVRALEILADWQNPTSEAMLLQIFTRPIFSQPTFFFELIERRVGARGFGEGNFQALFEAIEREQLQRS